MTGYNISPFCFLFFKKLIIDIEAMKYNYDWKILKA